MGWWAKFLGWFGGSRAQAAAPARQDSIAARPVMNIPAPSTLVAKVERLDDKDRDMLRVADEALRRGFPEEARQAYWKAIRLYMSQSQHLKAISVINSAIKLKHDDHDAWIAKGESCLALDRRRDAALAFWEAANLFEMHGEQAGALDMLERCIDLDRDLEGLRIRYLRLGGTRDVWSEGQVQRPKSIVRGQPVMAPPVTAPHLAAAAEELSPEEEPFAPMPEPVMHRSSGDYSGPIDLNISSDPSIAVEVPKALPPSARPMVRFNIPQQSTVYEPGLPSAIRGTEHEAEASGEIPSEGVVEDEELADAPVPDAQTQAMDISSLSALIQKAKLS